MRFASSVAALAALIVLASVVPVSTQPRDAAATFAAAKTVRCDFTLTSASDWKDGPQAVVKPAKLSFRFEEVDSDGGTANAIGPFGASEITVRVTTSSMHLMQSFREGPVYLTTVFAKPVGEGRWLAAHTRHEFTEVSLPGYTSRPEQYYGACSLEP